MLEPFGAEGMVIVAAFRREDLVRLHSLLVSYESPYTSAEEWAERAADVCAHERLRRKIALLL